MNIQGLDDNRSVNVRIDDEATLTFQLENDNDGISWQEKCGRASSTILSNAPPFLPKSVSDDKLKVAPTKLRDIGTYVIGVKQIRYSR